MLGLIQIPLKLMEMFQWALDQTSAGKWNGEIMNGFGDKQIGKWWREMACLYRKEWSGREKRACAVENSDRAWQLKAQELGNDLKCWERFVYLGFVVCGSKQGPEMQRREEHSAGWVENSWWFQPRGLIPGDFPSPCPLLDGFSQEFIFNLWISCPEKKMHSRQVLVEQTVHET